VVGNRGVNLVERSRDLFDAGIDTGAEVRAGMENDGVNAETLGAIELVRSWPRSTCDETRDSWWRG